MGSLRQLFLDQVTRMKTTLGLIVLCLAAAPALSTIAISTATLTVPAVTVSAGLGTSLAALGLLKLKGAALLALAARRTRRDVDNEIRDQEHVLFLSVLKLEEDKCVRRFVCEVATGGLTAPEYVNVIQPLISEPLDSQIDSAKFVYSEAAKSGDRHRNTKKCQEKYSCPRTGAQIYRAAVNYGA